MITELCCVSLVGVRGSIQISLRHSVNITYFTVISCASLNKDEAAFPILYYGIRSPPRRVLLQLNLWYENFTVCEYLLTVQVMLTDCSPCDSFLLTGGDELLLLNIAMKS